MLAIGAGLALAQADPPPAGEAAPMEGAEEVLTAAEQVAAAKSIIKRGQILSTRVRTALNNARKDGDIIMVTCLNDKLTQINANLRNAQARLENLEGAVDPDQAKHEYVVLSVIGEKFNTLDREAAQCAGQEMFDTGVTKVLTEIDIGMLPFEDTPGFPPEILPPGLPTFPPPASGRR
jgi:hypothetical protein